MSELSDLQPKALWVNFEKICKIPHPSKHEHDVVNFIKEFGISHGLETIVDEIGNVIIRKPATKGMENRVGVILQGHVDMVPQKNSSTNHDFLKDPIQAHIEGEFVKAKGTTLGGDDGIGVAAALAVLENTEISHGPIEALFTIDEETGMTGASNLKAGLLKGDIFLNMDSEEEGILYIGCAGGLNANLSFNYHSEKTPAGMSAFKLALSGLKGGHSGADIHLGRANANKLMNRFLKHATKEFGLRMSEIDGGGLRNAIPFESFVTALVPKDKENALKEAVVKAEKIFQEEYAAVEPNISFKAEPTDLPSHVIDSITQKNLILAVYGCPNGVMRMSDSMPGLVETSNNLASVKSHDGVIDLQCLLRSSVDSSKEDLADMIQCVFELAGAKVELADDYPGWKPNVDSPILHAVNETYKKLFGTDPCIKAIHAGLECGLLGGVYPNWDMISFGPTIQHPHSPDEQVEIKSVKKFWDLLVETLKNVPTK